MNCPNCNNPLQPHQRFCPACGTRVEALTSDAQQTAEQWQPQEVQPEPQQAEWRPQSVQPEPQQAEWRPQSVQPEPQQAEWRPQSVQPEPQQVEWRPQSVQPEPPYAQPQEPVWQPQQAQPQQPQAKRPQQPSYQPPQSGQTDRYAAQFQQYQQPSRFANPKHAQGSSVVFPKGKKQKDKK